eukprot:468103-Pelagomonas_calceolata.AAC.1
MFVLVNTETFLLVTAIHSFKTLNCKQNYHEGNGKWEMGNGKWEMGNGKWEKLGRPLGVDA